jgi:excisionase family DNA binding protein
MTPLSLIQKRGTGKRAQSGAAVKRKRHPNPRLAKIHRSYTVEEVASLYGVHRNTVREWVKRGLPTSDDRRPILILGRDLVAFLHAQRTKNKRTCQPGEIYCVRCRAPTAPAGDMADYEAVTETLGNLVAICSACETLIYRRVSLAKLAQIRGKLDITMPQALPHIGESAKPSVNSDFR